VDMLRYRWVMRYAEHVCMDWEGVWIMFGRNGCICGRINTLRRRLDQPGYNQLELHNSQLLPTEYQRASRTCPECLIHCQPHTSA
jgi:hypothetical protein